MTDEQQAEAVVDGLQGKFRNGDMVYVTDRRYGYRRKGKVGATQGLGVYRVHLLADTHRKHSIEYYEAHEMERA